MGWWSCTSAISSEQPPVVRLVSKRWFAEGDSWTRYKMNRPSFMRRYTTFFDSIHRNPTNPHVDGDTLKWLPLMFIVVRVNRTYHIWQILLTYAAGHRDSVGSKRYRTLSGPISLVQTVLRICPEWPGVCQGVTTR